MYRGTLDGLSVAVKVLDRSLAMQVSGGLAVSAGSGSVVGWWAGTVSGGLEQVEVGGMQAGGGLRYVYWRHVHVLVASAAEKQA